MPKNRITEKGRLRQNRGRGHGEFYRGWVQAGDFPSPTGFTRLNRSLEERSLDLFPPHETVFAYELIWREQTKRDITDIREQYPLPSEKTLAICERLGIKHPKRKGEIKLITVDVLLDVINSTGHSDYEAYDIVTSTTLSTDPREIELLEVRRTFFSDIKIPYYPLTENELNSTLAQNVKLIMRCSNLQDHPDLRLDEIRDIEPELFQQLKSSTIPFRFVARDNDLKFGLPPGSSLSYIYFLIWSLIWKVDMNIPIKAEKYPLHGLERMAWKY